MSVSPAADSGTPRPLIEFRVTFGHKYGAEEYGADPHPVLGYQYAHKDGWVSVWAPNYDEARALVMALLGASWSMLYEVHDGHSEEMSPLGWEHFYPKGELLRIVTPEAGR